MTRVISVLSRIVVAVILVLVTALVAGAQDKPPEKPTGLEPIVVEGRQDEQAARERRLVPTTGTKTETNILDLPVSIGVVDKRQIEQQGAMSVMEALSNVSGIYVINTYNAFPVHMVRGFFRNNVTVLYDGLREHAEDRGMRDVDLFNLERIEVLKGPSSVLYGQDPIGGVINYVTKKPTKDPVYEGSVSYGSFDTIRGSVGAGGPIVPGQLFYRLDVGASRSDGYEDRTDYERYQGAGAFEIVLPWDARLTVSLDGRYDDTKPYVGIPVIDRRPAPVRRQNNYNIPDTENWVSVLRGRARYEQSLTPTLKLRNQLYYYYQELEYRASETYTVVLPRTVARDFLKFTRDDYLVGDQLEAIWDTTLGPTKHKVLGGVDGSYNRLDSSQIFADPISSVDLFDPVQPSGRTRPNPADIFRNNREAEVRSYAAYVQDQIAVTEQWKAVLGARFDHVNGQIRRTDRNQARQKKFDEFSYRAGLVYQPLSSVSLYGSYATASKPRTLFSSLPTTSGSFKAEEAEQWEAGVKTTLLDNRFVTTLAWFNIDKENLLFTRPTPQGPVTEQIGAQRSRGVELDLDYLLTRDWRVTANYSFIDALFVTFVQNERNLAGKSPEFAPQHLGALWTTYNLGAGLNIGSGVRYVGDRFADNSNTTPLDGYFLWDAMLSYRWKNLEVSFNVKNVMDVERYDYAVSDPATNLVPGRPREFIGSVRVAF